METINKFSNDVCEEIKYYVYRLVDPTNGNTFYVGKGKGNRVFAHAKGVIKNYNDINYFDQDEDDESLKIKTIKNIIDSGLEVIYIIQQYGLTEEQAFWIESALIDAYCLDKLTNKIKGHSFGGYDCPINAITLQKNHSIKEYEDVSTNPKYILIKIKNYWLNERNGNVYETVRSAWKLSLDKVKKYKYVLAVVDGIVKKVFEVDNWHYANGISGRVEFDGKEANESIANIFLNKRIPARFRKKGQASPALYSD